MSEYGEVYHPDVKDDRERLLYALIDRRDVSRVILYLGWNDAHMEKWLDESWFHAYRHNGRHDTVEKWAARFIQSYKPDPDIWSAWKRGESLRRNTVKAAGGDGKYRRL